MIHERLVQYSSKMTNKWSWRACGSCGTVNERDQTNEVSTCRRGVVREGGGICLYVMRIPNFAPLKRHRFEKHASKLKSSFRASQ